MHISEEMLRCFLHDLNGRAKQLLSKGPIIFLYNRLNTVDLGPFQILQPRVGIPKAEVAEYIGRELSDLVRLFINWYSTYNNAVMLKCRPCRLQSADCADHADRAD